MFESRIDGVIEADELIVGRGVVVQKGATITGKGGRARRVVLGDFCFIGEHTTIMVPEFSLGDYSKLHAYSFCHGVRPLQIGRNCWIGGKTTLDSLGGLDIDDNVGIGGNSQVWTHIQFGDIVEGSRFHSSRYMHIGKDAWFVGQCLVSPVRVGEKSMAMLGSVVTRDMQPNHIYAGVPAKDMTDKLGPQFEKRSVEEKAAKLQELIDAFVGGRPQFKGRFVVARSPAERRESACWFDVSTRTYNRRYDEAEVAFLRAHVPLVKFTPDGAAPFVRPQESVQPFRAEEWA